MPTLPPTDPALAVAGTSAATWAWGRFQDKVLKKALEGMATRTGQKLVKGIRTSIGERWTQEIDWDKAAATYRQHIIDDYGWMKVLGMHGSVPLDDIFTDELVETNQGGLS